MDLAKVGDKVACSCKGGPHRIVSGASTAKVDGIPVARVGDKGFLWRQHYLRDVSVRAISP